MSSPQHHIPRGLIAVIIVAAIAVIIAVIVNQGR